MTLSREKNAIQNNTKLWDAIREINEEYSECGFDKIVCKEIASYEKRTTKEKYGQVRCGGKVVFGGTFDFKAFLVSKIFEEKHLYTDIVEEYRELAETYHDYKQEIVGVFEEYKLCKSIDNCIKFPRSLIGKLFEATPEAHFHILKEYENELLNAKIFAPVFPTVKLKLWAQTQYDIYSRIVTYDIHEIIECYDLAIEKEGKMSFVKKQRAIVSDSLRYDVMRRDGFRCCYCGATTNDGIKLEVDHIVPVSKGGKSEMENLQTLCERCNRGKGTK